MNLGFLLPGYQYFRARSLRFLLQGVRVLSLASMVRGFPIEDHLDQASNYGSWNPRVLLALEEYDVKDFVVKEVPMPKEEERQASWRRHDAKARNILMDYVKSHLIFHIFKEEIVKDMFDILKNLFEHESTSRSITLKSQLHIIKMMRLE